MIRTDRLTLDELSDNDKNALVRILRDGRVRATYIVNDLDDESADRLFAALKNLSHSKDRIVLGIYLGGQIIGLINDTGIDDGAVELGWAISPEYQNRGYATEAVKAITEKLFADGYKRIFAAAFEENRASIRVMEKCSMTRIGKEDTVEYRGKTHRCVYYAIER